MPLKLNVGGSRKVGEANYGSRGASINVEMELDSTLVNDPAKLQEKIRQLFVLVRTALAEELKNGNGSTTRSNGNGNGNRRGDNHTVTESTGSQNPEPARRDSQLRGATTNQIKAIYGIAKNRGVDLAKVLQERFQVRRADDLSIGEASKLIDALKSADNGEGG